MPGGGLQGADPGCLWGRTDAACADTYQGRPRRPAGATGASWGGGNRAQGTEATNLVSQRTARRSSEPSSLGGLQGVLQADHQGGDLLSHAQLLQ